MHSLNDTALESNKYMKINFDGGDLSSDAGLLLVKEFCPYKDEFYETLETSGICSQGLNSSNHDP